MRCIYATGVPVDNVGVPLRGCTQGREMALDVHRSLGKCLGAERAMARLFPSGNRSLLK